jgi:hypothetical protein
MLVSPQASATNCSKPGPWMKPPRIDGGDVRGEAERRAWRGCWPRSAADGERTTSDHKIVPSADIEKRQRPATTKTMMAVITTGETKPFIRLGASELIGNNFFLFYACLFPASIMSTARPSQVCSTVRVYNTAHAALSRLARKAVSTLGPIHNRLNLLSPELTRR